MSTSARPAIDVGPTQAHPGLALLFGVLSVPRLTLGGPAGWRAVDRPAARDRRALLLEGPPRRRRRLDGDRRHRARGTLDPADGRLDDRVPRQLTVIAT